MTLQLRGHHLLCLLGFRGMGYSPDFTANMADVYSLLREHPETEITIVEGADDLCRYYPSDQPNHCGSCSVHTRDQRILELLALQHGDTLAWGAVLERVGLSLAPEDLNEICATCPWLSYGLCQEGVGLVRAGHVLPRLREQP